MNLKKFLSYSDAVEHIENNRAHFKRLYTQADMTARNIAENQNINYDNNFQKALLRVLGPKGKGHGGARPGSGQKKKK